MLRGSGEGEGDRFSAGRAFSTEGVTGEEDGGVAFGMLRYRREDG
jgi:hypothetical protein